jgi:N-acetylglutamate synthase-like GNAT family acetyltransferase
VDQDDQAVAIGAELAEQLCAARCDRETRHAAGLDTAAADRLLHELERLARELHDVVVIEALHKVIVRHGAGPYPVEDMAALAGVSVEEARRGLEQLAGVGLAARPGELA